MSEAFLDPMMASHRPSGEISQPVIGRSKSRSMKSCWTPVAASQITIGRDRHRDDAAAVGRVGDGR